jgi:N6-adenosine-specific RNA methylase IME4
MKIKLEEIEIRNRKRNLNPDKVTELASSFSLLGQLQPISVINKNHGFELLAGWHRIEAARLLGWSEIDANIFEGDELECELVEIDENLIHNSLTVLEQGEQLQRRNQILEEMGLRAKRGDNQYSGGPEMISGPKTTADIGKEAGMTGRSISSRIQIARDIIPEVKEAIRDTPLADSTTQLLQLARLEPEEQVAVVEQVQKSGAKNIEEAKRNLRRIDRIESTPIMPDGKYNVIYADPPWKYDFGFDIYGAADRHYHTMSIEDLCKLPVGEIVEDNAVLFLWVTSPKLFEAPAVIKAWGFEYKTSFVWDKVKHVMGHYNSVRHEFLLVCVRGSFPKQNDKLHDSVISIERPDNHSEKPEYFRKLIEEMYPKSKKVELFARTVPDGWDVWGNEL